MDDKTEELREIFVSVADEETVTEDQAATRGSLADQAETEQIRSVIEALAERYELTADLSIDEYCQLAHVVYEITDGSVTDEGTEIDDEAIADRLDVDVETARQGRFDLHLYVQRDLEVPADPDRIRTLLAEDTGAAVATELDLDQAIVERFEAADAARNRSLRASNRFRDRFEELLGDGDLAGRLTAAVQEDGLDEATEDMETDVSF